MAATKKYAFGRIKELTQALRDEVDQRLLGGATAVDTARWLQNENGKFKDLKLDSLKKNLERYRATDLRDRVVTELVGEKNVSTLAKRMNAMDEMERLCGIQRGRVDALLVKESNVLKSGVVMKMVSDEIRLFKENLVELGKLQLETGVLKRAPKSVSGQVLDPTSGEVKHFNWTEEQNDLYRQLEDIEYTSDEPAEEIRVDA